MLLSVRPNTDVIVQDKRGNQRRFFHDAQLHNLSDEVCGWVRDETAVWPEGRHAAAARTWIMTGQDEDALAAAIAGGEDDAAVIGDHIEDVMAVAPAVPPLAIRGPSGNGWNTWAEQRGKPSALAAKVVHRLTGSTTGLESGYILVVRASAL